MANLMILFVFLLSPLCWPIDAPENAEELLKRQDLTYKDLAHKHKGCPENSLCNPSGAQDTLKWEEILGKQSTKHLKEYSYKNGILATILGNEESHKRFNGTLWDSSCPSHQKPPQGKKIYKLQIHIKKTTADFITVQSDQKQYEIPRGPLAWADPVSIQIDKKILTFYGPYNERPLYFAKDRLFYLLDYNDQLYTVSIGVKGDWKIEETKEGPKEAFQGNQSLDCPEALKLASTEEEKIYYSKNFCQELWDLEHKNFIPMMRRWSCQ